MRLHPHKNRLLGLAGLAVIPVLVAGCGGGVPGNAVATIDGTTITKKDYQAWAPAIAKSSQLTTTTIPDPPEFTRCIADKRAKLPKPGKGQKPVSDASLKEQCDTENEQILQGTMGLLLQMEYVKEEAEALDVAPSAAEIKKSTDGQIKQAYPKPADLQNALKQQELTEAQFREYLDNQFIGSKIGEAIQKRAKKTTDADIAKYYNANKRQFAQPETRDLRVVLTKTKAQAEEAKAAIEGGQSFTSAVKEFSTDEASKAQNGKLAGVAKGQQEAALDKAVFSADRGELTGPVKTQFGWYVFEVTKSTKASQQSLEESKAVIKQQLDQQAQTKASEDFGKSFEKKYKAKTECAAGYRVQLCKNAPKETPTPTPPAGTAPQQGQQPQQQQQQQQQPTPSPTQ